MPADLIEALAARLSELDRPGYFCAEGAKICPMPAIVVEGVGPLALPILASQAEQLVSVAEVAPYGRGGDTLVDTSVRRTWQIGAESVRVRDTTWPTTLKAIVAEVAAALGAPGARAALYKLLVYDEGGFFVSHRDTEKVDGMFATLVVGLPSLHEGGELRIRHRGEERSVHLGHDDITRVTYAAFYADCSHEVLPVTSGHRVCLVYNLVRDGAPVAAPDHRQDISDVAALLRRWGDSGDEPTKVLAVLEHHYTPAGLSFGNLKNGDAAAAQVLVPAAREAGCDVHLAMVSIREEGAAEGGYSYRSRHARRGAAEEFEIIEVIERRLAVEGWRAPDDVAATFGPIPWEQDELCPSGALDDVEPDEQYFTEATGNEGGSFERTYRRAALVLWPKTGWLRVAAQAGPVYALPLLDTLPLDQARTLAELLVDAWPPHLAGTRSSLRGRGADALRGALLIALARLDALAPAQRFFDLVLLERGYSGVENEGIAACWERWGASSLASRVGALFAAHMAKRTAACVALLSSLLATSSAGGALLAEAAIASLSRSSERDRWAQPVPADVVAALLQSVARCEDASVVAKAVEHILSEPARFPMDEVLVPAAALVAELPPTPALQGARELIERVRAHLTARVALPLEAPRDWSRPAELRCSCELCVQVAAFLADGSRARLELRAVQAGRTHVEQSASHADLDFVTVRRGSPHTLVATKNRRSYERRAAQRTKDLGYLARLAG